jgi:uncharacterized membrane protein YeaQ/YmgE (transglycosylase-associated protein family)
VGEIAQQVVEYLRSSPILFVGIAFIAGFAADRTVSYERRSGVVLFTLIGVLGLFLAQFVILFFGLQGYLESLPQFRMLFDFIAAYVGSFIVAAIIHFVKPM